jgi:predicted kinase
MNERRKTLILTVGLSRSGKSTWAYAQPHPRVEADAIRLALHGQIYQKEAEDHVWAIAKTMVKALFLSGHDTVILSNTHLTPESRDNWRSDDWDIRFKIFGCTPSICKERAQAGDREDLLPIIDYMADKMDLSGIDESEIIRTADQFPVMRHEPNYE